MPTLRDILTGLDVVLPEGVPFPNRVLGEVTHDSRQVQPGGLFVARRGETEDGHNYIPDAVRRGAAAVLAERMADAGVPMWPLDARKGALTAEELHPQRGAVACILVENSQQALEKVAAWWRSRLPVQTIGITGSVGKTSTKEVTAAILGKRYVTLKSERSLNTDVGMALTLLQLRPEHQWAVLEMGMYARGEIAHLCRLAAPRYGIVTNVGPTHLERLGSIEAIAAAKSELVEALPADGVAILNFDDERVRAMAGRTQARVFSYGLTPGLDLWADAVESFGLEGIRFRLHRGNETLHVRATLLGAHSVQTALAAAAMGLVAGLTWDEIGTGLGQVPNHLRMIVAPGVHGSTILDDSYNASPVSVLAALNVLAEMDGRRIAVLGDLLELGSYEKEGHRVVGRRARDVAHLLVAVGERGRIIGEEALAVGMPPDHVFFAKSNEEAVAILSSLLQAGDFVLVKGSRGMHMEDIVRKLQ